MNQYPQRVENSLENHTDWLRNVSRERMHDVQDFTNLPNVFLRGRKVAKVPSSSADITGSREGDFNVTDAYAYFCINNAGTLEWRRVVVSSW